MRNQEESKERNIFSDFDQTPSQRFDLGFQANNENTEQNPNDMAVVDDTDNRLQQIINKMKKNAQDSQSIQVCLFEQLLLLEIGKRPQEENSQKTVGEMRCAVKNPQQKANNTQYSTYVNGSKYTPFNCCRWFDRFILLIIFLNSLFLAIYDYGDRNDTSVQNQVVNVMGRIFTIIFTGESLFKILAYGFIVHRNAYLRDGWNWLDFIVVIIGWIELLPSIPNLKGLRTLRVLRPLRSINAIPSMKNQITTLIESLKQLVNVLMFLMFLFIIFGILGVQLYQGQLYQRCRLTPQPDSFGNWPIDKSQTRLCSYNDTDGWYYCNPGTYCGAPSDYSLSLDNENLTESSSSFNNYGITTFDNLGVAMLTIFQSITLEGWSNLMYNDLHGWLLPTSTSLFSLGTNFETQTSYRAFFLLNIILVVIITKYSDTKHQQQQDEVIKKEKAKLKEKKKTDAEKSSEMKVENQNNQDKLGITDQEIFQLNQAFNTHQEENQNMDLQPQSHDNSQKNVDARRDQSSSLPKIQNSPKIRNQKAIIDIDEFIDELNNDKLEYTSRQLDQKHPSSNQLLEEAKVEEIQSPPKLSRSTTKNIFEDQVFQEELKSQKCYVKYWANLRAFLFKVCMSGWFSGLIMLFIVLNTLVLALDRYPQEESEDYILNLINMVLTWCFFGEMMIKVTALGIKEYARDKVNLFDAGIVILTVAENILSLAASENSISSGGAISGFRAVRLFRIFKLARNLKSFQVMLQKIMISLKDIGNFSVLLFLFLFTYTLLGMEMFSQKVKFDKAGNLDLDNGTSPRENFDTFVEGFTTIFIALIGDGWNSIMYNYWLAVGSYTAIFFISLQVIGKYILLNLFLAILLENFEELGDGSAGDSSVISTNQSMIKRIANRLSILIKKSRPTIRPDSCSQIQQSEGSPQKFGMNDDSQKSKIDKNSQVFMKGADSDDDPFNDGNNSKHNRNMSHNQNAERREGVQSFARSDSLSNVRSEPRMVRTQSKFFPGTNEQQRQQDQVSVFQTENEFVEQDGFATNRSFFPRKDKSDLNRATTTFRGKKKNILEDLMNPTIVKKASVENKVLGKSLFLFGPRNALRVFLNKVITHRFFDPIILVLIIFTTLTMTVDSPLSDPESYQANVLDNIDIVVTVMFVLEATFKIIVYGFLINGQYSYLRSVWNVMDFVIVIFSILSVVLSDLNIQFIKVIRMVRVLRPLRMISRNEGLKIAVQSLINAVPSIINALIIALLFFILFGIFGTNYFKGQFYYCVTDNIEDIFNTDLIITKWDCLDMGGDWINKITNFDNILMSMMSLFIMSGTEGWADIMFNGVFAVDIDYQPKAGSGQGWVFFFMAFMIIGSFFTLNLFVSIVVNTYYDEKEKLSQNDLLTKYQKKWLQMQVLCFQLQPLKPKVQSSHKIQQFFQKLTAENSYFDMFILGCIVVNTILLTINWYDNPNSLEAGLEIVNYVFTAIFTVEAIFKIIAYGKIYFTHGWNVFDFIIVIVSYVTLIIGQVSSASVGPKQTTIIRAFRIGRIFRLIKKAKFLRIIFNTIILTIPSLGNIGGLLGLLLFVFSILGVQAFATVALQSNLDVHGNFQNFGMAFLTLLRLQTGENWNMIMEDTLRQKEVNFNCTDSPTYHSIQENGGIANGCGSNVAYLYFICFQLVVSIIFLNLFVAIILQAFSSSNEEEGLDNLKKEYEQFRVQWAKYDTLGTGFILIEQLALLIDDLESETKLIPVEINGREKLRNQFISQLQVPTYSKFTKYYFQDVLSCISKKFLQHEFVLESIKRIEMQESSQVKFEKEIRENLFEQELDDINSKGASTKIQMIEENKKHSLRYSQKMLRKVDKFEDKVYDSSYVIWVPVIQKRIKPLLLRLVERKREQQRIQNLMDQNNLTLIMETGGQLNENKNTPEYSARSRSNAPSNFDRNQIQHQNFNNRESTNLANLRTNRMTLRIMQSEGIGYGQTTTGEVGGTMFMNDESLDHELSRVIDEELKQDSSRNMR